MTYHATFLEFPRPDFYDFLKIQSAKGNQRGAIGEGQSARGNQRGAISEGQSARGNQRGEMAEGQMAGGAKRGNWRRANARKAQCTWYD
jgi:hypothetical protein